MIFPPPLLFIVPPFIFRLLIHLKSTFLYEVRQESTFIFVHRCRPFPQHQIADQILWDKQHVSRIRWQSMERLGMVVCIASKLYTFCLWAAWESLEGTPLAMTQILSWWSGLGKNGGAPHLLIGSRSQQGWTKAKEQGGCPTFGTELLVNSCELPSRAPGGDWVRC